MKKFVLPGAALALLLCGPAIAGDPAAGQVLSKTCAACHGADGNSASAEFPRLAGQHEDYLIRALKDYQSGARKNPIMAPLAANLTPRDIDDLAAYFSNQKGLATKH